MLTNGINGLYDSGILPLDIAVLVPSNGINGINGCTDSGDNMGRPPLKWKRVERQVPVAPGIQPGMMIHHPAPELPAPGFQLVPPDFQLILPDGFPELFHVLLLMYLFWRPRRHGTGIPACSAGTPLQTRAYERMSFAACNVLPDSFHQCGS